MIDLALIYSDSSIVDPATFAGWNGSSPLFSFILDEIFREERQREAETLPPENQREDLQPPKGRYSRRRYAS